MNYRFFIYAICTLISCFVVAGINFNNVFKKNRIKEAKLGVMLLIMCLSYLSAQFIISILETSSIL